METLRTYSLANYVLSITPDQTLSAFFAPLTIGGQQSAIGSVGVSYSNNALWSTTGYATGAWVHEKNLDRTGTITITINQLSENVNKLINLCNAYYGNEEGSVTISISDNEGEVVSAIDCMIQGIPSQTFGASVTNQSWTFTCGQITMKRN